jgi:hypothetical protein
MQPERLSDAACLEPNDLTVCCQGAAERFGESTGICLQIVWRQEFVGPFKGPAKYFYRYRSLSWERQLRQGLGDRKCRGSIRYRLCSAVLACG